MLTELLALHLSPVEIATLLLAMAAVGACAGFLSGLLGIGGGIVLVPGVFYIFQSLGYDPTYLMHVAVGTSLSVIIPTGFFSARTHYRKKAFVKENFIRIGSGIVVGTVFGTIAASYADGVMLKLVFAIALSILALSMVFDLKRFTLMQKLPARPLTETFGVATGMVSSLVGIGGATFNVPFQVMTSTPIHKAVGTSSALGILIAIPAAIGFVLIGWGHEGLPPLSLGYINMLAWVAIVPFSILCAPLGATCTHCLSVKHLRILFAGFMVFVMFKLWFDLIPDLMV